MTQLDPSSAPVPLRPENLEAHFDRVLHLAKFVAPFHVSVYEHSYDAVRPSGWSITFGRHRTRVRFHYIPRQGMVFQHADAPASEWYPDWERVKTEPVDWCERTSSEYEAMELVLRKIFAT